ncbi:unannotated protein [freshwater metagenome]|uniref:Unannotated protein n=1 Tax=freshwater metagenome TaxID=449393 RepID=A0A6J7HB13_9ZZZZ|nr:hypothetical protein [Actinomycetota bacterium]
MRSAIQRISLRHLGRRDLSGLREQSGFVLMAVLASIAITSIVIAALLAMMLTTIQITENQEEAARQARAADGAVTAAINQLRLNQTNPANACAPGVPAAAGLSLPFESSGRIDTATVTCSSAADELGKSAGDIKLSGSEYKGTFDWKSWPWASLQPSIDDAKPTLVHQGSSALKFNGNLSSKGGAAPLRSDSAGTPALDVRGTFVQAAQGIGAVSGAGGSCGALDGVAAVAATTVRATAGATCGDPLLVPVSVAQDYAIDESVPTSPDLSALAGCPASSVITFSPGKYDQNAVEKLNEWFGRGPAACLDKTFYFPYGRYYFDANTVIAGAPAPNQHALILNNPSSTFVFGKANGWDPAGAGATAANFPQACDPAIPGASIIVSGRTEFRHLAGRLAVCPYLSGTAVDGGAPYPALLQQTAVPTQVTSVSAVSPAGNFSNAANLLAGPSAVPASSASFTCSFAAGYPQGTTCTSTKTFTVTLASAMSGAVGSAALNVTGNETNNNVSGVQARTAAFSVTLANGQTCSVPAVAGAPDKGRVATYELLAGSCKTLITLGEQLDGAQLEVTYNYKYARICPLNICSAATLTAGQAQALSVWNVQVVANPWVGSATSVEATPAGDWVTVENARVNDTATTRLSTLCMPNPVCAGRPEQSFTRAFSMDNFDNFVGGISGGGVSASDSHLESLGVVIKQLGTQAQGLNLSTLPGQTTLTLTLNDAVNPADRTVCTRSFNGVSNQAGDNYFPLVSQSESSCGGVQLTAAQRSAVVLFGAALSVSYRLDCAIPSGPPNYQCTYFQPVGTQYVGLVATSDSYSGPVIKSQLTVDSDAAIPAGGATGGPASANFFGAAYLKNVALDLHWNGKASGASLFGGELQLNSLGSLMAPGATADVVCCTEPESNIRKVRLTASVGGEAKLSAVVALNRDAPTAVPVVLEWTVCGRNGNCSP